MLERAFTRVKTPKLELEIDSRKMVDVLIYGRITGFLLSHLDLLEEVDQIVV